MSSKKTRAAVGRPGKTALKKPSSRPLTSARKPEEQSGKEKDRKKQSNRTTKETLKKPLTKPATSSAKKTPVSTSARPAAGKPSAVRKTVRKTPKALPAPKDREEILKLLLIKKRKEILGEAKKEISKYIKGETRQLVESVLDDGDWSVIDLSEDINLRRLSAHQSTLVKIDESLRKIKEGTYGLCEDCGETISAERLKVMPFAIYCRDCQEKRESLEKIEKEEL